MPLTDGLARTGAASLWWRGVAMLRAMASSKLHCTLSIFPSVSGGFTVLVCATPWEGLVKGVPELRTSLHTFSAQELFQLAKDGVEEVLQAFEGTHK
jgi:hypothetical protein